MTTPVLKITLGKKMAARIAREEEEERIQAVAQAIREGERARRAALPDEVLRAHCPPRGTVHMSCGVPCGCRVEGSQWWCKKAAAKAKGTLRYDNDFNDCAAEMP